MEARPLFQSKVLNAKLTRVSMSRKVLALVVMELTLPLGPRQFLTEQCLVLQFVG